jgi:uncharacterized protein YbjT (DUF2867 family)
MAQLTVLVCGATGRFAALTDVLIGRGHRVLAGTRRPDSAAAQRLRKRGAQIVRVDFDDAATLQHSAAHADAIVAAGTAHAAGPAADVRHGRAIVAAAAATGLDHLIYLTVAGAEHHTGVPILDSKHEVEQYLRSTDVPHTIVAPAYFMDNLWNPWNAAALAAGRMPSPLSRSRPLQQVPITDVLDFTAHVLQTAQPTGERIEIASDEVTAEHAAEIVSQLTGRPVAVAEPPAKQPNPLFTWLERIGTTVDIPALRRRYPDIGWHTFADWASTQDWRSHLG